MRILVLTAALAITSASMACADERQVQIEVSGLFCPSCSYIAGKSMEKIDSVSVLGATEASDGSTAVYLVSYDDDVITPAEIAQRPAQYGYTASVLGSEENGS